MGKIKVLSEFLANQIAAGEVVQCPESVVKELVENSLDANSNRICVEVEKAGRSLIHVWDNGVGMSKEDLLMAPLRHATSKLFTPEQLNEIMTFGFRGEALASISSVALLEIQSRTADEPHGWRLIAEPQEEFKVEPINMEVGTQIFVKNLFFNVPARRKFLKKDITELNKIHDTLKRLAISYPEKSFAFYDGSKTIFDVKGSSLENRIIELVGKNNDGKLLKVDKNFGNIHIYGYVGQPQMAKTGTTTQYFYLNHRSILSKNLGFAVVLAFDKFIERNLKPFFVLNIDADYKSVDVNVHPQKNEVKFDNESYVFNCIKDAVSEALVLRNFVGLKNDNSIIIDLENNKNLIETEELNDETGVQETYVVDTDTGEVIAKKNQDNTYSKTNVSIKEEFNAAPIDSTKNNYNFKINSFRKDNEGARLTRSVQRKIEAISNKIYSGEAPNFDDRAEKKYSNYMEYNKSNVDDSIKEIKDKAAEQTSNYDNSAIKDLLPKNITVDDISDNDIWQFHNKYIFLQTKSGLLVIDQHNAVERARYEKIKESVDRGSGKSTKQGLLFPVDVNLSSIQIKTIEELKKELDSIGFELSIDGNKVIIFAVPECMAVVNVEDQFMNIIDDYVYKNDVVFKNKYDKIIATIACKTSIKAGEALSLMNMKKIIVNLFACKMPHICPHGRPIIVEYPIEEFDRKVKRMK